MDNLKKYFNKKYNNKYFIIYPFLNKKIINDKFGKYELSLDEYNNLYKNFNKNLNNVKQTIYQYNDMELIYNHDNQNINYISKIYLYQDITKNFIINILDINNIESNKFPIVNKYSNEVLQEIYEYKLEYIVLNLIKEPKTQYLYYFLNYDDNNKNLILKELILINNIILDIIK